MTTRTKTSISAIAVFLVGSSITWASEPNDSGTPLKFEIKSTAIGPLSPRRAGERHEFGPWRPTYAAGIPFEGPTRYLSRPGSANMSSFLHSVLGEVLGRVGTDTDGGLSTAQREFLRATQGLLDAERRGGPVPQWYRPPDEPNSPRQLLLYAMTLEDAKAMAEAYARFVMEKWRSDVDERRERIAQLERSIATAEKEMDELEKAIESSEQALIPMKRKVPYRTEKEAMEAIAELDRMLNAAQVDIAGIRSKIKAIQEHLRTGKSPYDAAIQAKLQGMFVEESVALQGAEARKSMATQLRADANRFLDLKESLANAIEKKGALPAQMAKSRNETAKVRTSLESIRAEKPQLAEHTIAIYPVEWIGESEGN
jgi:uncharacterized coiled-coil protein SlyX